MTWQCRWSPTLGALERTHQEIWGTREYENDTDPTIFMGIYGLPDFWVLWRHKGEKHILWCGTDILHFMKGYWLEDDGGIKLCHKGMAKWMNKYCTNWVENEKEQFALKCHGIEAKVQPSFLGDIDDFKVSFKPGNKVYASVSGDNFEQYGWEKIIKKLAPANPRIEFHLYGNSKPFWPSGWPPHRNIIVHGRVPKEQMNEEIKNMQAGLRMLEFDGASEIIVKAMLMGQYCFSIIDHPFVNRPSELSMILSKKTANIKGRTWWRKNLNLYPWNSKK